MGQLLTLRGPPPAAMAAQSSLNRRLVPWEPLIEHVFCHLCRRSLKALAAPIIEHVLNNAWSTRVFFMVLARTPPRPFALRRERTQEVRQDVITRRDDRRPSVRP